MGRGVVFTLTQHKGYEEILTDLHNVSDKIKSVAKEGGRVLIVSHAGDTDGITSGAIAVRTVANAFGNDRPFIYDDNNDGVFSVKNFEDHIDYMAGNYNPRDVDRVVKQANSGDYDLVLTFDWGSGLMSQIKDINNDIDVVVADHHAQDIALEDRGDEFNNITEINPNLYGLDEEHDASGSTLAYLIARDMDYKMKFMAAVGILGSICDVQEDLKEGKLKGDLHEIAKIDADASNGPFKLTRETTYEVYGRDTVPYVKALLTYYDRSGQLASALEKNHDLKHENKWQLEKSFTNIIYKEWGIKTVTRDADGEWRGKTLSEVSKKDQDQLFENVYGELKQAGSKLTKKQFYDEVTKEIYTLQHEAPHTKFKNISEYTTVLSACAKTNHQAIGINLLLGDNDAKQVAHDEVYSAYRKEIGNAVRSVSPETHEYAYIANSSGYLPSITGVLAGIFVDHDYNDPKVSIVYSQLPDGDWKGSVRKPVDSDVSCRELCKIAYDYGGQGGGHPFAAGFYAPSKAALDSIVSDMQEMIKNYDGL